MTATEFWTALKAEGLNFFSGVPCSLLTSIMDTCARDLEITYVTAPREDAALGVASGAYLAGKGSGVLMQNSGLGNVVNGLTSFNLLYRVPVFMVISWRGFEGKDAPEHLIMGAKLLDFLELIAIPTQVMAADAQEMRCQVQALARTMAEQKLPVALIVKPGVVAG